MTFEKVFKGLMVAIPTCLLVIVCLLAAVGCKGSPVPKSQIGYACYDRGDEARFIAEGLRPDSDLYLILDKKVKDLQSEYPGYEEYCKSREYSGWTNAKKYIDKKNLK